MFQNQNIGIYVYLSIWHAVNCPYFLPHHEQVVLYEDELADNGVSLLTVKVVNTDFVSCVDRGFIFCNANYYDFQWLMMLLFLFYRESCQVLGFFSCNSGWAAPSSYTQLVNFFLKFFKWSYGKRIVYFVVIILIVDCWFCDCLPYTIKYMMLKFFLRI
jgi:hypothetical protein